MPDQSGSIEFLRFTISTDASLSSRERGRRLAILHDIEAGIEQHGSPIAQPNPNRARQFMPFAALKGYHELAHEREQVPEPKRAMTDELSAELSSAIAHLKKGCLASVTHYEGGRYVTTCGIVSEIDEAFHVLCIVKKRIAFEDILSIRYDGQSLPDVPLP